MKLGIALALALCSTAFAEPTVKVTVDVSKGSPPVPQPAVLKPEIDVDSLMSITTLGGQIRAEQEQILQDLINYTPDSEPEEKADYYLRLGELQAKQYRFWRLKVLEGKDPDSSNKAYDYLAKVMKTYGDMFANKAFRAYPKLDLALALYVYTMALAQQTTEARTKLDRLAKDFPTSKYLADAHVFLAEYHFQLDQLADAAARYKLVLKLPKSPMYWFATYKLAWVHMRQKQYGEAFALFMRVSDETKGDPKLAPLRAASEKGFTRAIADHDKPDLALFTFKRRDAATAVAQMMALGELYMTEGFPQRGRGVYRELIAKHPGDARTCEWQSGLARANVSTADGGASRAVELCQGELPAFVAWARDRRLVVR